LLPGFADVHCLRLVFAALGPAPATARSGPLGPQRRASIIPRRLRRVALLPGFADVHFSRLILSCARASIIPRRLRRVALLPGFAVVECSRLILSSRSGQRPRRCDPDRQARCARASIIPRRSRRVALLPGFAVVDCLKPIVARTTHITPSWPAQAGHPDKVVRRDVRIPPRLNTIPRHVWVARLRGP